MKITTDANDLRQMLKTVGKALENRPISTWMSFVLLEADGNELRATATNGMYTLSNSCLCNVFEEGSALLDGKMLCQLAEKLPNGEVTIEVKEKGALLRYGKSKTKISISEEQFRKPPETKPSTTVVIAAEELKNLLTTVRYAVSVIEDQRATINGILLSIENQVIRVVATDSFRLAAKKGLCEADTPIDIIVPGKSADRLLDALSIKGEENVQLRTDGKWLEMENGSMRFRTTLLAGKYIEYKRIIPTEFETKVLCKSDELKSAVERTMLTGEGTAAIKMHVDSNGMVIRSNNATSESVEFVDCDVRGNDQDVTFNGKYVQAALGAIGNREAVWVKIPNLVRPTMLVPEDIPDELHMLIPVRTY